MQRNLLNVVTMVAFLFLSASSSRAQTIFGPASEFGPYVQQATLTLGAGAADDQFGERAAVSGDLALAGGTGVVYVFERDPLTDTWRQVESIMPVGQVESFGRSLALDGRTAIVGSDGAAHVFRRRLDGSWREMQTLHPSDGHENFGTSVDIAGNRAIVGARGTFVPGGTSSLPGAAYIFTREQGDWTEEAVLHGTGSGVFAGNLGGTEVGVTQDAAIVAEVGPGPNSGAAYIFNRLDNGEWSLARRHQIGGFTFSGGVAIDRNTAVFGGGEITAFANIFGRNVGGSNAWGGENFYGELGEACCGTFTDAAISGERIILGLAGIGTGVDIVARNQGGLNAWNRIARLREPNPAPPFGGLGRSVAVSGDTALLGWRGTSAPDDNTIVVLVSDLDGDGLRDGIDSCLHDPLNNVASKCQRASAEHPILDDLIAQGDVTSETRGERQIITATFTNTSATAVKNPFFEVTELSGSNVLANADEGRGGVGATLSPDVGDGVLSAGESMTVTFRIRLRSRDPFQFFVTFHGDPVP